MKRCRCGVELRNALRNRARREAFLLEALESRTLLSAISLATSAHGGGTGGQLSVAPLAVGTTTSTLTLAISPDTIVGAIGTTFTAAFSGLPVGQVPTGTVAIFEVASAGSTTPIGTLSSNVAIDANGVSTFNAPGPFTVGLHFFFARFLGDSTFAAVDSASATLTVSPKIGSTVTLTVAETSPTIGQTVHLTAQVALADGQPPGLNSAQLMNIDTGQIIPPTSSTADGTTLFDLLIAAPTMHLVAVYAGDVTHAAGQSAVLTINAAKAPTTLTMTAGPYGRTVTADIGLPSGFPASLLPLFGGTVTLFEGTTQLGQTTLSGSTSARFVLATLPVGVHPLHAVFTGNALFGDSVGDLTITVVKIPTAVNLSVTNNGGTLAINFGLPGDVPPELLPLLGGTVKLYDGKKLVATIPAAGGSGIQFDLSGWRHGLHRVRAVYSGDSIFKGSISSSLNFILTPHGEKVPPGFAHAAHGLDNLGSSIPGPDDSPAIVTKKGKGHK